MMIIDYIMSMIKKTDSLTMCVLQINNNKHLYYVSLNICFVIYTMFIHSKKNLMNEIVELWKKRKKEIKNKNKKLTIQSLLYIFIIDTEEGNLCAASGIDQSINQLIDQLFSQISCPKSITISLSIFSHFFSGELIFDLYTKSLPLKLFFHHFFLVCFFS